MQETTNAANLLVETAKEIQAWQTTQTPPLATAQLIRNYPDLGSEKTFTRLCRGDTSNLNIENWLADYQSVIAKVKAGELGRGDDPIYDSLTPAAAVAAAILDLIQGKGTDRILIIQGGTGAGKTKALECASALVPRSILVTADILWQNSLAAMLGDLLTAFDCLDKQEREKMDRQVSAPWRMSKIKEYMMGKKNVRLFIDECHHLSADGIDLIKGLINQFPGLYVVLAGMDTLWNRLTADRWQQAKQIILNRGRQSIILGNPTPWDVVTFFRNRNGLDLAPAVKDDPEKLGRWIAANRDAPEAKAIARAQEMASRLGAFAFLRRASQCLVALGTVADVELFEKALTNAEGRVRTGRRAG